MTQLSIFETYSASPLGLRARVALLARDGALIAATVRAVTGQGGEDPLVLRTRAELLDAVLRGDGAFGHILVQAGLPEAEPGLLGALVEASPDASVTILPARDTEARIGALLAAAPRPTAPAMASLAPGLRGGALLLRYQPVVRVADRQLVMVEALARWQGDPVALGAGSFVPQMEQAGLARALAAAVTRLAATELRQHAPRIAVSVSVNLPVEEFERSDTPARIAALLREARLPPRRLAIELTETSPVRDLARLHRSLRRFRAAGHAVLIDDFQLGDPRRRLLRLPFSGVKLDKEWVTALARSAHARQQVRRLARAGLVLTAEGVASEAVWRGLRSLGIARAQGFWVARPLPAALLAPWAQRWRGVQPR